MTNNLKLAVAFCMGSFGLCFLSPWALIAVVASFGLFGFILWSEKYSENELNEIVHNQTKKDSEIIHMIKTVESKVNALSMKNMGR